MENQRSQLVTAMICCMVAEISLLMSAANTALAQRGRPRDLKSEQHQKDQREAMLRNPETGVAITKIDQRRVEAAVKQMNEDFKQIQVVRNELVRSLLADKPLDYKFVSDKAAEINKRADRLKSYLMPPIPDDKEKNHKSQIEFDKLEMKEALVRLCNLVAGFVDNPVLKNPGITDVEQSTKAGGDLLSIIQLSSNIKRSAERLYKSPK